MLECKKNVEIVWLGEKKGGKYVYWQKGGEGARVNVALKKKKKTTNRAWNGFIF